ncbi:MAG: hypothetical protein KC502_04795 [Myxococcales bacterium]|nr:hypothetical protein [Myxococcales bacterium]
MRHPPSLSSLFFALAAISLIGCGNSGDTNGQTTYSVPDTIGGGGTGDGMSGTGDGVSGGTGDGTSGADTGAGTGNPTDTSGGGIPPVANHVGYKSQELRIRIVGPSGRRHTVVSGGVVDIAGVLFGNADEITWKHSNGAGGKAYGAPFFQTGKVELTPGDNQISVTAKKGDAIATDHITITYNPVFQFADRLRVEPRVIKAGKKTNVHAIVNLGKTTNFIAGSLKVFRTDENGNQLKNFGPMVDNGKLSVSGDEIKGDGLYSQKFSISDGKPTTVRIRASILFKVGNKQYAAFTDVAEIDVVSDIAVAECTGMKSVLDKAKAAAKAAGKGSAAQKAALDVLKASSLVDVADNATSGGNGVWVRFKNGVLAAINLNPKGTRGGQPRYDSTDELGASNLALSAVRVQSKRAVLLDPFRAEFGDNEIGSGAATIKKTACPAYEVEGGDALVGSKATLNHYRNFYEFGIIATATHGDAVFGQLDANRRKEYGFSATGSQEIIWSGHAISCNYFKKAASVQTCSEKSACGPESDCFLNQTGGKGVCVDHLTADLRRGRVIMGADGVYGITSQFIPRHAKRTYPRSLVYLGACRSLFSGSLAAEFFAAGAAAVVGYDGNIDNAFATKWGKTFIQNVIGQKQLSGVAHVQIEDASHPGSFSRLVGAQNLDAYFSDLLNPSWEAGNVTGWIKSGDGRVIAKLGSTVPVGGKFMGILSTGLGYTSQTGELRQRFCVQPGRKKLSFWWKFFSEEFKEFCGSKYQDAFRAELVASAGKKTIVNVKVDDLCQKGCYKGGNSCGGQYKGLTAADVSFDQGGVYMTPWVKAEVDIGPFAGNGNVNLRLFTTDVGDSVYDTAVLVDKVDIQ